MAKNNAKNNERRAVAEQLRREQERRERRRSTLILGACVAVVVVLLASALIPYLKQRSADRAFAKLTVDKIGVAASAAQCEPVKTAKATGNNEHIPPPQKIDYPDSPPAFGPHWGNFLSGPEIRNFYNAGDRPPLERMVHSLEHGHTLVWYDETVKPGTKSYDDLKKLAKRFPESAYFMAVPWLAADGKPFPEGKHVVMTHWTGPKDQQGAWQYCGKTSGAAIKKFMDTYDKMDTPEPGAA